MLTFCVVKFSVISSVDHRPSVIACASILASSNEKLSQQLVESKLSSLSSLELLDNVSLNYSELLSLFSFSPIFFVFWKGMDKIGIKL